MTTAPAAPDSRARRADDAGVTLVEVLTVVLIIGVLAAIAIPVYVDRRKKAFDASAQSDLRSVISLVSGSPELATQVVNGVAQDYVTCAKNRTPAAVTAGLEECASFAISPGVRLVVQAFFDTSGGTTKVTGFCAMTDHSKGSGKTWYFASDNGSITNDRPTGPNGCTGDPADYSLPEN